MAITDREVLGFFVEPLMQNLGMGWMDPICTMPINSDQDSEDYNWLGQTPQLIEMKGEKRFGELNEFDFTVKNAKYQNGLRFQKELIQFDKTDQVRMRTMEFAMRAQAHWASLVAPLILAGDSTVCYDGQYLFDTDHSEGDSGTQSNDIEVDISALPVTNHGSTTAPSAAEMVHAIMNGVNQIIGFKDDQGEYCNEGMMEFMVLTGTTLAIPAMSAMRSRSIDGGDDNILIEQDSYRLRFMQSPRFNAWTDKFAVFATAGVQKPFIRQQRRPNQEGYAIDIDGIEAKSLWLDSEHCFKNDECLLDVQTARAAAVGDWKKGCLVTLT